MNMEKEKTLARLKRIEGQVRGLSRMVEEGADCVEVITQLAAVTAALRRAGLYIVNTHLQSCLDEVRRGDGPSLEKKSEEIKEILGRYLSVA